MMFNNILRIVITITRASVNQTGDPQIKACSKQIACPQALYLRRLFKLKVRQFLGR